MSARKLRALLIGVLLAGAESAFLDPVMAWGAGLRFVAPRPNQVVGGDHVFLWAAETGALASAHGPEGAARRQVIFEASTDNRKFSVLPQQTAPDFGPFSHTSAFDTTAFPSGTLFLRARYADQRTGPTTRVRVNRLPKVSCKAASGTSSDKGNAVSFDCAGSRDPDGRIDLYLWEFGDGKYSKTHQPRAVHTYPAPGKYQLELTAVDNRGQTTTLIRWVTVGRGRPIFVPSDRCGCERLIVNTKGSSTLRDQRRPTQDGRLQPAPLGKDPDFISFNFEVMALLEPLSDPALCEEGQVVKRTSVAIINGEPVDMHKKACTAGRDLPGCDENADCDNLTCRGGLKNGQSCNDAAALKACQVGGGACVGKGDGVCTEFPLFGADRGNDDYRRDFPGDVGPKLHCPSCGVPRWLDSPGLPEDKHEDVDINFLYAADFLIFMKGKGGGGSCQCHVVLTIGWDGTNNVYQDGTGMTRIADAETTANCSVAN